MSTNHQHNIDGKQQQPPPPQVTITDSDNSDAGEQQERPLAIPSRPSLARLSRDSAAHHSSPSIMTMSKMYQEQKQLYERERERSQTALSPLPPSVKPLKSPRIKYLKPPTSSSSKNIEKRVLSPSKRDADYFSKASRNSSRNNSPGSASPSIEGVCSPGPKLPTFHTHAGSTEDMNANLTYPHFKPKSLSSSKIYDRRMKQLQEDPEDDVVDIADEPLVDEEISRHYDEKLRQMTPRRRDKAEFFPGDSEEEESDVDIDSDSDENDNGNDNTIRVPDTKGNTVSFAKVCSSVKEEKELESGSSSSLELRTPQHQQQPPQQPQPQKKRNFFQRVAFGEEDEFDHIGPDDNIFTRMIGGTGGGSKPVSDPQPQNKTAKEDEELTVGTPSARPSPPPQQHQYLDPELFKREAQDIINSHHYSKSNTSSHERSQYSDETTLGSTSGYFLAPNPDYYIHADDSMPRYEDNLDGPDSEYISPPEKVRGGVLSSLLKLYDNPWEQASRSKLSSPDDFSPDGSVASTPFDETPPRRDSSLDTKSLSDRLKRFSSTETTLRKKPTSTYTHKRSESLTDMLKIPSINDFGKKSTRSSASTTNLPSFNVTQRHQKPKRPKLNKGRSAFNKNKREQAKAKITVHIADVLHRQRFILRMCKALMLYGAPTHRLEEYLTMTSRVLEIDGQFIYLPGCMVVSFGDPITRTSEVQLVKCVQGLDLYKLHRIQRIYKQVIHDIVSVDEASVALEDLLAQKPTFSPWMCVLLYGFSSSMVAPFAFGGGWINLPVAFGTGCLVGILQYVIAPRSQMYINVFEVAASIVVSFVARALGSISGSGICFSSVTQGCLALILPGWFILCGALELQSRNLVAGSVRMFYAIIYSMFLGYGITLGSALYGWIDKGATSEITCSDKLSDWYRFLFVPGFSIGLALINQARLFQLPVIVFIAGCGHAVSYFAGKRFYNSTQLTAAMGSFVIGILGNLYSRIFKGLAFSAMLPAVFVQIPAGISSAGSLLSGVQSANQIVSNTTTSTSTSDQAYNAMSVGMTLINVCIGITVGLFASAIVVYPFGKRSTSIFTL